MVMKIDTDYTYPDLFAPPVEEYLDSPSEIVENEDRIGYAFKNNPFPEGMMFLLKTESYILKLAHAYNKILSLSNSRTRILAHQVESTHRIVNAFKQRFLIADEVGLGKTIEAGLVIKEMIYRYDFKRIMIVCPASLLFQWQNEMESKFNEKFLIMDRKLLNKAKGKVGENGNPWNVYNRIICSLDFIKNKDFAEDFKRCSWDAVIFDEAHRLRRDANNSTLAYNVAEIISSKTKALLLLSATPFRGKLEELFFLIALADKNILGPFQSFSNEYCMEGSDLSGLKKKMDQIVIRRTKNDIGGFTKRFARTIRFDLYPDERFLYDETTSYVVEEFNRALQSENRAVGFVMTVFQKLLDSSSYALHMALLNRSFRLKELLRKAEEGNEGLVEFNNFFFGSDFLSDDDIIEADEMMVQKTIDELKVEIFTLDRLIGIAQKISVNKKGERLVKLIKDLRKKGHRKFLIFTQFRTTQDYIFGLLGDFKTEVFHGSMNRDQKEEAILNFSEDTEILIATEAGGEGRNMQFCDVLINYDLPWSPLKIEQRIGRIHRFGQTNDVHIYNFSTRDTVAERVLQVLSEKLKLFEESIGTPDIMLGQVEDDINLNNLFMEMASGRKKKKDVEAELNSRIEYARHNFEKLSELTVTDRMDFNYDEYYKVTLKERAFSNRRIEKFIDDFILSDDFAKNIIGQKNCKKSLYRVVNDETGELSKLGTFDSEKALADDSLEFLAFGHPVVEKIIKYCNEPSSGGETGVLFMKGEHNIEGILFNFLVKFSSMSVTHELFPVIVCNDGAVTEFELKMIEDSLMDQDFINQSSAGYGYVIESLKNKYDDFYQCALNKLYERILNRKFDMNENMDIHIDPELEKIGEFYTKQIRELEEKLELQECQKKWYGRDMKSAITRTSNKIQKARNEMESLIREYREYSGIKHEIKLISAGVIISSNNM